MNRRTLLKSFLAAPLAGLLAVKSQAADGLEYLGTRSCFDDDGSRRHEVHLKSPELQLPLHKMNGIPEWGTPYSWCGETDRWAILRGSRCTRVLNGDSAWLITLIYSTAPLADCVRFNAPGGRAESLSNLASHV